MIRPAFPSKQTVWTLERPPASLPPTPGSAGTAQASIKPFCGRPPPMRAVRPRGVPSQRPGRMGVLRGHPAVSPHAADIGSRPGRHGVSVLLGAGPSSVSVRAWPLDRAECTSAPPKGDSKPQQTKGMTHRGPERELAATPDQRWQEKS